MCAGGFILVEAKTKELSANALKTIAMTAMTIDHFTAVIFPDYPKSFVIILLHTIGRLAAPIFWFFAYNFAFVKPLNLIKLAFT